MNYTKQLKVLIKQNGYNQILNDLKCLRESDKEVMEIFSREERRKNLSGKIINGKELTYEEHLEHICEELTFGFDEVIVDRIENLDLLEECSGMLENVMSKSQSLIEDIRERIDEINMGDDGSI
jgi:hypothetical protein